MADQLFSINSGFYDSVDQDRLYSAEQMNMPYKRLVSNGVFATPQGTPSTDFQVTAAGGMTLQVAPGLGIAGDKWVENPGAVTITVPGNTATVGRIDSVILRTDTTTEARASSTVYRTGLASSTPAAPALDTSAGVSEYRIANVAVAASAVAITQADITDMRGSADCPWITSLINQVDTSVLLDQYRAAYADFMEEMEQRWQAYMDEAGEEYNLVMNLAKHESTFYTLLGTVTRVPINISVYDPSTDILQVFINGVMAGPGRYTIESDGSAINLTSGLPGGQRVDFVVLKSMIGGDLETALDEIQAVDEALNTRVPAAPTTAGTYALQATVTGSGTSYAWVSTS